MLSLQQEPLTPTCFLRADDDTRDRNLGKPRSDRRMREAGINSLHYSIRLAF